MKHCFVEDDIMAQEHIKKSEEEKFISECFKKLGLSKKTTKYSYSEVKKLAQEVYKQLHLKWAKKNGVPALDMIQVGRSEIKQDILEKLRERESQKRQLMQYTGVTCICGKCVLPVYFQFDEIKDLILTVK